MDARHFDDLAKHLGSRRAAIGGLLAGLLLPLEAAARKKGKQRKRTGKDRDKGKGKGKATKHKDATAEAEPCWRAGACIPKKGANVSRCDLGGYSPSATLDCTGCNISRANLHGANLSGANLTRANLSGSCLVDATLSGATTTNSTNLYNAIFCNTVMADGSINNSGCNLGTPCCPTCGPTRPCTGANEVCSGGRCVLPCGAGGPCLVFATSTNQQGGFGGLSGGDGICNTLAAAQGLPGPYKVWLSDSTGSPSTRFTQSTGPYVRVDGAFVANNWADLTDGSLLNPININESGVFIPGNGNVWTNTNPDGTPSGIQNCANWTVNGSNNAFGGIYDSTTAWTTGIQAGCGNNGRLYCFQQAASVAT